MDRWRRFTGEELGLALGVTAGGLLVEIRFWPSSGTLFSLGPLIRKTLMKRVILQ